MIKKFFLTGLAILLPIALTIWILFFILNILTKPFLGFTTSIVRYYGILDGASEHLILLFSKLLVLFFMIAIIILVGFLGRLLLLRWVGKSGDYILHRIPLINKLYKGIQEITHTIFGEKEENQKFSSVVLVPFPYQGMFAVGLITRGELPNDSNIGGDRVSIFIPGTPNPTMGFMLLFKPEEVVELNIPVDVALKFIVSCGVINEEIGQKVY